MAKPVLETKLNRLESAIFAAEQIYNDFIIESIQMFDEDSNIGRILILLRYLSFIRKVKTVK